MTAYRDQSEVIFPVVQTAHGFSPGQALRRDTTVWVKALADTSANGSMVGVVDRVINANTFYLRLTGKITGLSGLVSGTTYYLSTTTPGALTPTAPSTVGQLYRPVLVADSATSGYVYNDAGMVVGTGPPGPPGPIGDITTSPIWDAKGDLAVGTGPDASVRLPIGTDRQVLTADSAQAAGAKWKWGYGPVYNVKDYGAVGDGAHDDAPNINAAITAAAPTGGIVFLPPGRYRINSPIDFSPCSGTWNSVTLQGSSGYYNLFGTSGGTTVIDSHTGTSAIKAIGASSNNFPQANLRNFKIVVSANQGVGVPTVDWYWIEDGFLLENVAVQFLWQSGSSGPLCTGDGIRIIAPQYGWELRNCVVASTDLAQGKTDGRAFILSDGTKPDGSGYYNPATDGVGYKQSASGVFNSCGALYFPIGYSCTGDITGVTFNSCKSMPNGVTSVHPSIGVEINRCSGFTFNGMHMECHSGTSEGLRLWPLGEYPRNIRYQGVMFAIGSIGQGVRVSAGKDCDINVVFRGGPYSTVLVRFEGNAAGNTVRWSTDPTSFTGSILIDDYSSSGDNLVWSGNTVRNYYSAGIGTPQSSGPITFTGSGGLLINSVASYGRLAQRLELNATGAGSTYGGIALSNWTAASQQPILDFNKSRSATPGTMTVVQSQDNLGQIAFRGADGANFQDAAWILGSVDGTPGTNDMPGRLVFYTTPDGTNAPLERLRIDNQGNIIIGTGALPAGANNGFLWLPNVTSTSLGTSLPTYTGRTPICFDTASPARMWAFYGGAWHYANFT
jgi:pectate lyase-like protein